MLCYFMFVRGGVDVQMVSAGGTAFTFRPNITQLGPSSGDDLMTRATLSGQRVERRAIRKCVEGIRGSQDDQIV